MIRVGAEVEIKPAYSCETESSSIWDKIAGCAGVITEILHDATGAPNDYVLVQIKNGDEVEVYVTRLKFREAAW
jgi:hypothetical protein